MQRGLSIVLILRNGDRPGMIAAQSPLSARTELEACPHQILRVTWFSRFRWRSPLYLCKSGKGVDIFVPHAPLR